MPILQAPAPYPAFDNTQPCAQTDPELFFPEDGGDVNAVQAKKLCSGCDFLVPCLEYALTHHVDGVWGGTTSRKRKRIRAQRRIVAVDMPTPSNADLGIAPTPRTTTETAA